MGETLYPQKAKRLDRELGKKMRTWRIEYDLIYDGGNGEWVGYYRTYIGARIAAYWNVWIASWGGSAELHHKYEYGNAPGAKPLTVTKK